MQTNKILRLAILAGVFILPFIPFVVANSLFFPFITGKNFTFRIVVEIMAVLWIILALRDPKYMPRASWILWAVAAFVAIVGIADIFSVNPTKSFLSNFERMEGWITLAHLFVYFVVAATVAASEKVWQYLFQTSIAASVIISIHGIMQLAGQAQIHQGNSRLDASFGNAAYLAIYMLFHIFLTAILLARSIMNDYKHKRPITSNWLSYVYAAVILLQLVILFYTATRGAILGLIFGSTVAAVLMAVTHRHIPAVRKFAWGAVLGIVLLVSLFILFRESPFIRNNEVLNRFATISLQDGTTQSRFTIWSMSLKGFAESPKTVLIGWGQESYNYVFNKYYDPKLYSQEQWFDRAHNIVFDWLIAAGALGLLAYLSVFVAALYVLWKKAQLSLAEKSLITGLLLGYFFNNIFVFDNIVSYILFFTVIAYIYFRSVENEPEVNREFDIRQQYVIGALAIVAGLFIMYTYNVKPIMANQALIKALTPAASKAENLAYMQKAIGYNTFGIYEMREQLFNEAVQIQGDRMADPTVKTGYLTLANEQAIMQINDTPSDARYQLFIGSFHAQLGLNEKALPFLEKAVELSPRKQTIMFSLGSAYFGMKQYDKALEVFKRAYELAPAFGEARNLYSIVSLYSGTTTIATELLGEGPIMDPRFLGAYEAGKHYDLMIAYLKNKVEANPNDIQARMSLAAGYLTADNKTNAIIELQNILKVTTDATTTRQVNKIIADIRAGKNPLGQ